MYHYPILIEKYDAKFLTFLIMKRRQFLKNTTLAAASATLLPSLTSAHSAVRPLKSIGIQLFSLPKLLEMDFRGGIEMLAKLGYQEIQLFGPFPFSAESAKNQWKAITPMLGFTGSGYFGHKDTEVKAILDEFGIKVTAVHTDLDTLQTNMEDLGEAASILGYDYVGIPAIPEHLRATNDDYKKMAEVFNAIGEKAKQVNLKFAYHNHGYGHVEQNGAIPFHIIMNETDPGLVFFEMDLYWTTAAGINPVDYLEAYPNRFRLMHVKDMSEKKQFNGDGGSPQQWMELFPYMTTLGSGVMDLKSIIPAAQKAGVKHFYVEQDLVANPQVALKTSIEYLKGL